MTTRRSLIYALSLGFAAMALHAQSGLVKSGNQPIPGATITATEGDSKVVTTTGENGRYTLPPLAKGSWTIEASMTGFTPVRKQVTDPDAGRSLDFTLNLQESQIAALINKYAGMAQQAGNPLESQIQSATNTSQADSFAPAPSQSGNEAFLVSGTLSQGLSAGAAPDTGSVPQIGGRGGATDSAAQSQNAPGFGGGGGGGGLGGILGGLGGGRMSGGGGRPPAGGTQAGSYKLPNEIHGMAFATLDNSALNAKPFSITGQDITQPAYAQSRFGVVLGGPLVVPKIVKDPATFFFVAWFATRARNPYTAVETVPSELERQGNFSQSIQSGGPVTIYDPSTHTPFPGNILPRIDPTAQKLLGYFPLPNQPGLVNNYDFQASVPQNTDNFTVVGFRSITKLDRVGFHFSYQRRDGDNAQPFGFLDSTSGSGISSDVGWMRNFTPAMIGTLRFTFNRNDSRSVPYFANDAAANLGIPGASSNPQNYGPPNLNFTNFGALSDGAPNLTRNQSQGVSESLTLTHGKHSFSFGLQYTRNDLNSLTDQNGRGTFNFTGLLTSELTPAGPVPGTGFDLADFLLGLPQSSSIRYGDTSTYFRNNAWSGYAQDDWKVRTNLTLILGARYEYFGPFSEKYGRIANLDIAPGFTAVSVVTPGVNGFPSGLINPDYRNFSPRIGIAWKVPFIHRSTTVRAGYGIYYNGQAYYAFPQRLAQQPPFATSNSVNTSAADVLTFAQGFASIPAGAITNTYAVDRNYRTPYAQTWNLTIQHDLPSGFFMELGYLGTKGTHLDVQTLPNESAAFNLAARTQLGNAVGFTYDSSVGNSIYNALQTRLQRRFRHGISMTATYNFSKSIDDSSTFGGAGNTVAQNWLNLAAERGLSSFDRRHSFSMSGVWTSPFGVEGSHVIPTSSAGRLLKDWQVDSSITAQTGTPLTARQLGNTAMLAQTGGIGSGRAQATGQDLSTTSGFFNLDAFTIAPPGQYGDAGRNTIPGPSIFALNLGFGRSFELGDSHRRLELRMEANNVLNHVNYTNVNTVVNATNYGLPVSAAAMRTMTAILRFRF
jgi:hypothetical protein